MCTYICSIQVSHRTGQRAIHGKASHSSKAPFCLIQLFPLRLVAHEATTECSRSVLCCQHKWNERWRVSSGRHTPALRLTELQERTYKTQNNITHTHILQYTTIMSLCTLIAALAIRTNKMKEIYIAVISIDIWLLTKLLTDTVGWCVCGQLCVHVTTYANTTLSCQVDHLLTSSSPLGTGRLTSFPSATLCSNVPKTSSFGSANRQEHVVQAMCERAWKCSQDT